MTEDCPRVAQCSLQSPTQALWVVTSSGCVVSSWQLAPGAAFCGTWGDLVPGALGLLPAAQDWLALGTRGTKGNLTCYGSSVSKAAAHLLLSSVLPCMHTSAAKLSWALL